MMLTCRIALLWVAALLPASACAQILSLTPSTGTAAPGQTFTMSLSMSTQGQSIAGIQFDLQWDAPLHVQVAAGAAVRAGSKSLFVNPISGGLRCLIAASNGSTLPDGELLDLYLSSDSEAAQGSAQVQIANALAATPAAGALATGAPPVVIQLQPGSGSSQFPPSALLNAATWSAGPISPGEIISLVGGLGVGSAVLVNGIAAPTLYAGPDQINAIVPFGLDVTQPATITIQSPVQAFSPFTAPVAPVSPGIFTLSGSGFGPGAILNQDYSVNSFQNPASPGSVIMIYGTGFGLLTPPAADGQTPSSPANTALSVTAAVGGIPATVLYAGAAPGIIYGVEQINVMVPAGVANDLGAPIALTVNGITSPSGVTVAIHR